MSGNDTKYQLACCQPEIQGEYFEFGPAVDYSYIVNGFIVVGNNEYESIVQYCPYCGRRGRDIMDAYGVNSGKKIKAVESLSLPDAELLRLRDERLAYEKEWKLRNER